jgi:polyisoprenyl-phosphate glycosyltransferase
MNTHNINSLVVVTAIYEDGEASSQLFKELEKLFSVKIYIVAIDDGSVRQPLEGTNIRNAGLDGVIIKLKRNVGHQRAIAIGLNYVADHLPDAERVVIMDSDGEDLPVTIKTLITTLDQPNIDIAVAQRKSRVETLRFRVFYVVYKLLFQLLSGHKINFGNFMALKPNAVKRMVAMHELWIHVAGCVLKSKMRIAKCALDRGPRYAGHSKMNFVGLVLHGFKGLMVFAEDVLVRVGIACAFITAISMIAVIAAITLKIFGIATPGWFSIALGILVIVILQTGALTLMTLMLSSIAKSGAVYPTDYRVFIDRVLYAKSESAS